MGPVVRSRTMAVLALALASGCELVFPASGGGDDGDDTSPDADVTPPPLCNERPGVIFCDGFESTPQPWLLAVDGGEGTIDVTPTAHSGNAGLRAVVMTPATSADAEVTIFGNRTAGDLYARAWFRATDDIQHADLMTMMGAGGPGISIHAVTNEVRTWNAMASASMGSGFSIAVGAWVCLELHVSIDPTGGTLEVFADGSPILQDGPFQTTAPGGYSRLEIGIPYASMVAAPLTVFVDDVVAATQPIGCN